MLVLLSYTKVQRLTAVYQFQQGKSKKVGSKWTFTKFMFFILSWHHINWSLVNLDRLRTLDTNFSSTWDVKMTALSSSGRSSWLRWWWCLFSFFTTQFWLLMCSLIFLSFCVACVVQLDGCGRKNEMKWTMGWGIIKPCERLWWFQLGAVSPQRFEGQALFHGCP